MKYGTPFFVFLILFINFFFGCNAGTTKHAEINYGYSNKISENEIKSAVDIVIKDFKYFIGCDLRKLWYDEAVSNSEIEDYLLYGKGSINDIKKENIIILLSDFYVDSSGGDGSFEPNSTYENWMWILIREKNTANWVIDDWGK